METIEERFKYLQAVIDRFDPQELSDDQYFDNYHEKAIELLKELKRYDYEK